MNFGNRVDFIKLLNQVAKPFNKELKFEGKEQLSHFLSILSTIQYKTTDSSPKNNVLDKDNKWFFFKKVVKVGKNSMILFLEGW